MQDEANIVKQYEDANVSGRIEILIKYYPNFIRLVEGYEQSLSFINYVDAGLLNAGNIDFRGRYGYVSERRTRQSGLTSSVMWEEPTMTFLSVSRPILMYRYLYYPACSYNLPKGWNLLLQTGTWIFISALKC